MPIHGSHLISRLMIYPITLGSGKRLFVDGMIPAAFKVTESKVTPSVPFL